MLDIERCLADTGIVRHRGKIVSTINNAKRAQELESRIRLACCLFLVATSPARTSGRHVVSYEAIAANPTTPTSTLISKDLKKRGWTFVGPTTIYAFMQAMGLVNDHIEGCHCRATVEDMRRALTRPQP